MTGKATQINFTKAAIEAIEATSKRQRWHDTRQRGLVLTVTPKGAKTFYVYSKVDGAPVEYRLGQWPAMPVDLARKRAAEYLGRVAAGENPAQERRGMAADPTFAELFAWYIEHYAKPRKRTWDQDEEQFRNHCGPIAKRRVSQLTRADVRQLHAVIGAKSGPYAANRALALVRSVINQGIGAELLSVPANPAVGIERFPEEKRDRRLYLSDLPAFLQAVDAEPDSRVRDFFFLLLSTGVRKSNLQAMRWDQIDLAAGIWRIPQTKNGTPQTVPLEPEEIAILRERRQEVPGPWVFPSATSKTGYFSEPKDAWARIIKRANMPGLRMHDLRRTLGSLMVDTGASLPIVGKALNHLSPQATAVYARLALDPVREAKARALAPVFATMREMTGEA